MMEPVTASGLASILGPAAGPMLGRAAGGVLGKRLGALLDERGARKKAEEACAAAFDEWLVALVRDVEEQGEGEQRLRAILPGYIDAVAKYFEDEQVCAELLRPFTEPVPDPVLKGELLVQRWDALDLPALPAEFNAVRACQWYVAELNRKRQAIDVLRPLWQAQSDQRRNELLEAIRGPWAAWDIDKYADAVRDTYQALDITTLELTGRFDPDADQIKLKDIFIPQAARRSRPHRILPRDYLKEVRGRAETFEALEKEGPSFVDEGDLEAHWEKTPREPIFEIIASEAIKHLVILGDPGAGKSCLARYMMLTLLEGFGRDEEQRGPIRPWVTQLSGHLPLLIELRRFVSWEKDTRGAGEFLGYLHHLGSKRGFGLNHVDLDRHLRSGRSLVIFDGLDEVVDPKKREGLAEAITGFARTYALTRVVVTSRIAGFDHRPFIQRASDFTIVTLDDLDQEQIERFSRTWFALTLKADQDQAEARHSHLVRSVRERPQLRTLAGNPLLLTVIALIARRQELPAARAALYEHALQIFCHQWDFEDKKLELSQDSPLRDLELEDKIALLRQVAWSMVEGEGLRANAIERDDLRDVVKGYFASEWWPNDQVRCRRAAREMIEVLEQRNYVLCQQGGGLFGFIHRTFLEYLCAAQLVWSIEKERSMSVQQMVENHILTRAEDDSWSEIIRLLAGQLQQSDSVLLIGSLINRPFSRWKYPPAQALCLGITCIGERRRRDYRRFQDLMARIVQIVRDERATDVRRAVISDLGKSVVDQETLELMIEQASDPSVYGAVVEALGNLVAGDPALRALLIQRARDADASMRWVAIEGLGAAQVVSDPAVRALLIERAGDADASVRRVAVQALGAAQVAGDPAVRALLIERTGDADASVRRAAVEALGNLAAGDPAVLALLIERASDGDGSVRRAAIERLEAAQVVGVPAVRALLIERTGDANASVRGAAVGAIGKLVSGDPAVRALLIERTEDAEAFVRWYAIGALRDLAAGDPAVRALLIERTSDADEDVCFAAIQALGAAQVVADPALQALLIERARGGYAVVEALGDLMAGDPAVRALLIKWAGDADASVRRVAIEALGALPVARDTALRALLIERASDADASVRRAAITGLWEVAAGEPVVRAVLIERVGDADASVREVATGALGDLMAGDPTLRTLLIERASDADPSVRRAAITGLWDLLADNPEVRALLIERVVDADASVREVATGALGDLMAGDPTLRELLVERAGDADASVRKAAVGAWFRAFGNRVAGLVLSRDRDGLSPWLDPRAPVDAERIRLTAQALHMTEDQVRAVCEGIADELPLALPWRAEEQPAESGN